MTNQERVLLGIEVTLDKRQQIEDMAHRRGYDAPDDYLRALIEADAKAHGENLTLDDEEDPIEGFREGWRDAMTGNIYPLLKLYLEGTLSHEEVRDKFATLDYRLAKRQMTWLRRNPDIMWVGLTEAESYIQSLLAAE